MKSISPGAWSFAAHMTVDQAIEQLRGVRHKHVARHKMEQFLVRGFGTQSEKTDLSLGVTPAWAQTQAEQLLDYDRKSPHAFTAGVHWTVLKGWTCRHLPTRRAA